MAAKTAFCTDSTTRRRRKSPDVWRHTSRANCANRAQSGARNAAKSSASSPNGQYRCAPKIAVGRVANRFHQRRERRNRRHAGHRFGRGQYFRDRQFRRIVARDEFARTRSSARILRGKANAGDVLNETFHFVATKKLRVAVLGTAPGDARTQIIKRLGALDFVQSVDAALPHDAELEFATRGNGIRLNVYRNQQQLPPIAGADVDEIFPKIGQTLENLYTVNQLVALDNPAAKLKVDLQVNSKDFDTAKIGGLITFSARADQDCYLYLLDVDPAGKVTLLFPNKYAPENKLRAGIATNLPAPNLFRLRAAGPAGGEAVKAIVTTAPLKLEVLEAANGEIAALAGNGASIAGELLAQPKRELNGGARGIEVLAGDPRDQPITTEGWATDIVLLTIRD